MNDLFDVKYVQISKKKKEKKKKRKRTKEKMADRNLIGKCI